MKNNTKLGLKNSILVAAIFISGCISPIIMIGLAIYTLLYEEDQFSRLSAKRAIMIYILFAALYAVLQVINSTVHMFGNDFYDYNSVYSKITYFLTLAENLTYLIMAIRAFFTVDTTPGALDSKIESIMTPGTAPANNTSNAESAPSAGFCSGCGAKVPEGYDFCNKCGKKVE